MDEVFCGYIITVCKLYVQELFEWYTRRSEWNRKHPHLLVLHETWPLSIPVFTALLDTAEVTI